MRISAPIVRRRSSARVTRTMLGLAIAAALSPAAAKSPDLATTSLSSALTRASSRLQQAQRITQDFAARAQAEGLGGSWQREMLNALMQDSSADLARVSAAASARDALALASDAAHAASADDAPASAKSLGSANIDLTYIPIYASCRIVDTRQSGGGGPIAAGATRKFSVSTYSTQGGSCDAFAAYYGINHNPPSALAINVTVDATSFPGGAGQYIQVYPDGATPVSSWLNFGPGEVLANSGVQQIPGNQSFDITTSGKTNIIVDVVGAFVPPNPTSLACATSTASVSIATGASGSVATAACAAGTALTGGGCAMNFVNSTVSRSYPFNAAWNCTAANTTALTDTLTAYGTCCKVPGGASTP